MLEWLDTEIFAMGTYSLKTHNLVSSGIIIVLTYVILKVFKYFIENPRFKKDASDSRRRHSIYLLLNYLIWVIAIVSVIQALGFEVKLLLAGSAALLVGIGFGLQPIFADFLSGIFLLLEGTIKVGEIIEVDGLIGKIIDINLRSTEVETRDNYIVVVPNSKFVTEKVINWSKNNDCVRFTVQVGVSYKSDVHKVKDVLQSCFLEIQAIDKSPKPYVRFIDFADSSLNFELVFWTHKTFEINDVKSDLRFVISDKLKQAKIEIPFPQRDLHIYKENLDL